MKRNFMIILGIALLLLTGCDKPEIGKPSVQVAVMVEDQASEAQYVKGIELALDAVQREYEDYDIQCVFYEDFSDYETGAGIVDIIASNPDITAVLATGNMDISKTAAYEFETAGKIMLAPYALYDSILTDHNYKLVFSTCYSAAHTGATARAAADASGTTRWAVCYAEDEFSRQEARSFTAQTKDSIEIADCVKEDVLLHNLPAVTKRWEQLGVKGVALFPYDTEGLDLFMNLKTINPDWTFIGDFTMDDADYMEASPERLKAFENFYMISQFYVDFEEADARKLWEIVLNDVVDTWLIQGYNNLRMIVDTAVKNQTTKPFEIAEYLRKDGYDGLCQTFRFDKKGQLANPPYVYNVFRDGDWIEYNLKAGNDDEE